MSNAIRTGDERRRAAAERPVLLEPIGRVPAPVPVWWLERVMLRSLLYILLGYDIVSLMFGPNMDTGAVRLHLILAAVALAGLAASARR